MQPASLSLASEERIEPFGGEFPTLDRTIDGPRPECVHTRKDQPALSPERIEKLSVARA